MPDIQLRSNPYRRSLPRAALAPLAVLLSADGEGHHGDEDGHGGEDHHEGMAGRPGKLADVDRTIAIGVSDAMDYTPASVTVAKGETIRFEVTNDGQLVHEFVLGSTDEILEHQEMMKRFPGMEHDEPNSVSLEPGASGEVIWQFSEAGELSFACLQPGHYEAGMRGDIVVRSMP